MITSNQIRRIVKREGKRISHEAISKIKLLLEARTKELLRVAMRNASFAGRKTIKKGDIPD